jgi:hypothetical protein
MPTNSCLCSDESAVSHYGFDCYSNLRLGETPARKLTPVYSIGKTLKIAVIDRR